MSCLLADLLWMVGVMWGAEGRGGGGGRAAVLWVRVKRLSKFSPSQQTAPVGSTLPALERFTFSASQTLKYGGGCPPHQTRGTCNTRSRSISVVRLHVQACCPWWCRWSTHPQSGGFRKSCTRAEGRKIVVGTYSLSIVHAASTCSWMLSCHPTAHV